MRIHHDVRPICKWICYQRVNWQLVTRPAGPTCSCKKQTNFSTTLLLGGPSHASAQGPSAPYATADAFRNVKGANAVDAQRLLRT